jgi:hypothetical protein
MLPGRAAGRGGRLTEIPVVKVLMNSGREPQRECQGRAVITKQMF